MFTDEILVKIGWGQILVRVKVKVRVRNDTNRVFARLYRGKPRLRAVEYLVRLIRVE